MSGTTEHPKVFISYSWTSPEHEEFVMGLAAALYSHRVEAIVDKWDLKPGQDKFAFMESMVVDPKILKVLVICDSRYQEKADARAGGVGTESQIISQELYSKVKQTKFIPVVCEYDADGNPCLPVFLKGRIFVDISTDEKYGVGLDQILRIIYEQPFHQKPQLGSAPSFMQANGGASYVREQAAAIRAIQDGKPNRNGLERQYIKALMLEIDSLYVTPLGENSDEVIYTSLEKSKSLRDQLSEYLDTVSAFSNDDPNSMAPFIQLMDGLGAKFGPPDQNGTFLSEWSDLYTFLALEFFLLAGAALLRHERWLSLRKLLSAGYLIKSDSRKLQATTYIAFDTNQRTLDEHRNRRLKLNKISYSAEFLRERCSEGKISFTEMIQADVFFALDSAVYAEERQPTYGYSFWRPRTTIYMSDARNLPVFVRAASEDTRIGIRKALGVKSAAELRSRLDKAKELLDNFRPFSFDRFGRFGLMEATNMEALVK